MVGPLISRECLRKALAGAACCLLVFNASMDLRAVEGSAALEAERIKQLVEQGDVTGAQKALAEALKQFPHEASLHNLQGALEAQQGHHAAAELSFKKAIEESPHYIGPYLNLGRLYQESVPWDSDAPTKALNVYERLLKLDPENVEGNYQSAFLLLKEGAHQTSLQRLAHLPRTDQERAQALAIRCGDYTGLGRHSEAATIVVRMLHSADLHEADVLSILPTLTSHRADDLALRLLQGLDERHLASFDSLQALGALYEKHGTLQQARTTLEKAAQFKPNSVLVLTELARLAYNQEDYTGALGYLAHAREIEPQNAQIHFFWGMICVQQNLIDEAYRALKKAVSLNVDNPYYNYALGAVAMETEDAGEAVPYLQKYCVLRPGDPRGRLILGAAYFNAHNDTKAKQVISRVARFPETAATAHYYLGQIANHQGDSAGAIRELNGALQANPDYVDAYAELGLIYLKQKQYGQAEEALQKALQLKPSSYTANLNLMILYQRTKDPRAAAQAQRFDEVRKERAEKAKEFLRTIEVRP